MGMLLHRHRAAKNITTSEDLKSAPETVEPKQVNPEHPAPETVEPVDERATEKKPFWKK